MVTKKHADTQRLDKTYEVCDNHTTRLESPEPKIGHNYLEKGGQGTSNTLSKPESMLYFPHTTTKKSVVSYFLDWVKFYGEGMTEFQPRHEILLVELFLKGKFFQNICFANQGEELSVRQIEVNTETRPGSGRRWSYKYTNDLGVTMLVCKLPETGVIDTISLEFSGSGMGALFPRNNMLDAAKMLAVVISMDPHINATRLDSTIEFPCSFLDYKKIEEAIAAGNYCGFKKCNQIVNRDREKGIVGLTLYLGSPTSHQRSYLYHTGIKHGYDAYRLEGRNSGKYARRLAAEMIRVYREGLGETGENACLVEPTDEQKKNTANALNDLIRDYNLSIKSFSFVDRNSKARWKKREQYTELPFWTDFKRRLKVEQYHYHFEPIKTSVQGKVKNMLRNFSGIHRMLCETIGKPAVDKLLRYFDKIHDNKNGGLFNEDLTRARAELKAIGGNWQKDLFDFVTRTKLREVGFYDTPMPRSNFQGLQSILELRENNLSPTSHQLALQF